MKASHDNKSLLPIIGGVVLVLILIIGTIFFTRTSGERSAFKNELESTKATLSERDAEIYACQTSLNEIQQAFALSEENGSELLKQLIEEQDRNDDFEDQLDDITGTVGKLDKLSKLDPELLQKYSQVFFLNEHYSPERFQKIDSNFLLNPSEPEHIHSRVSPFLEDMLEDAEDDGIDLRILSAFRSYDEQKQLKSAYTVTYGSGANTFSADQGYSEHQLGTTVDITTPEIGATLSGFENTEAYAWLKKNAHKYGFVLSYPEQNGYYIFEPWHWRFVGEDLADDLHDDGESFYDLDQRDIDKYLISIFD